MVLNKTAQKPVHGTTIVPHDGQHSSMMNEKHVRKKPEVDHPIASVDDLGAYEVVHGNFFHKNSQGAILNKEMGIVYACVVQETAVLHCQKPRSSLDTKNFALATRGAMYCRHQRLAHSEEATQNYELGIKYFNKLMDLCCQ